MYNRAHVLVWITILKLMSQSSCGVVNPTGTDDVFSQRSNTRFWLRVAFLWNLGETWNVHCLDTWKKLREYLLSNPKTNKKTLKNKQKKTLCNPVAWSWTYQFSTTSILIIHLWQIKPQKDDQNSKTKLTNGIHRRICILKEIIQFVNRTKRFKR